MRISQSPNTSSGGWSGCLPGGMDDHQSHVQKTCQVCIRSGRKIANRGLLLERALSAKPDMKLLMITA